MDDTEREVQRMTDEVLRSMSGLTRYLGKWFDRNGKLTCEISHENIPSMSSTIMGYAMGIIADNSRLNYVLWKRNDEIAGKLRKEMNVDDEPDESV